MGDIGNDSSSPAALNQLKILIVEDETMVAFLLEDMLQEMGCTKVRHAGNLKEAARLLDEENPDLAILDVNVGGEFVYPFAARLEEIGVPLIFSTGYGQLGLPAPWSTKIIIQKPYAVKALQNAVVAVLNRPADQSLL